MAVEKNKVVSVPIQTQVGTPGHVLKNAMSSRTTFNSSTIAGPYGITTDGTNYYVTSLGTNQIFKIDALGTATVLAGDGSSLLVDGTGTSASFWAPRGITTDGTSLFVADQGNNAIRKIDLATAVVTTLAGGSGSGFVDGTGPAARFQGGCGITTDGTNLYFLDQDNNAIRQIVIATGVVTTLAGGTFGSADGIGTAAQFKNPTGITTDGKTLYVADYVNSSIRAVSLATRQVTTLSTGGFLSPCGIASDGTYLYVADYGYNQVYKVEIATGTVVASVSGFNGLSQVTILGDRLFVTEWGVDKITVVD